MSQYELQIFEPATGEYVRAAKLWGSGKNDAGALKAFARRRGYKSWRVVLTSKERALKPSRRHVGYGKRPDGKAIPRNPVNPKPRWLSSKKQAIEYWRRYSIIDPHWYYLDEDVS